MAGLNLDLNTAKAYIDNQLRVESVFTGAQDDVPIILNGQIQEVLKRFGDQIIEALNNNLDRKKLNASGNLRQSHDYDAEELTSTLTKFKILAADYWEDANYGQPKGTKVSIDDLAQWIMNKPIRIRTSRAQSTKSVIKQARSLAAVFQKSIYKNGTIARFGYKGSNYFTEVLNDDILEELSILLSTITGQTIALSIKHNFETTK